MKSDRDKTEVQAAPQNPVESSKPSPVISRRALLRGATATVPTILTLQSGAALATTSNNMIGTNEFLGPQPGYDGTLCLNAAKTDGPVGKKGKYKLGDPPVAEINVIPDGVEFRSEPDGLGVVMTPREMCYKYQYPGPYFYNNGTEFVPVNVPQGGIVSATALASFTNSPRSSILIKSILNT